MPDLDDHERRLNALERETQELRSNQAIAEVRREHIDTRFDRLEESIRRVVMIILGGFLSAGVMFIVNGGLNVSGG